MSEVKLKKTYYPPKEFDEDLKSFVGLMIQKNWMFSGIDIDKLKSDPASQEAERLEFDAVESHYYQLNETFGLNQEERYQRFSSALNAARGAFRYNKAIMAELNRYKRSMRRPTKKDKKASDPKEDKSK